ncbi:MAG: CyaA/EF/ExoY family adenylyl cyclase toxin [Rubripirellula sp.]|nr:hypothetical protein [Rhodopirellula sp.]MCH1439713.1 CyaA/EF/ExoY family adenylyl cyclase toxin [Rubripirellula sp.]
MTLSRGPDALALTGMVESHAEAFGRIAYANDCVIMSRAVGKYATMLLEENYASKGFHNKAKSCDWGPMAGFVLDDPRFTKVGGDAVKVKGQSKALHSASDWEATAVPVFISEHRRRWLEKEGVLNSPSFASVDKYVYRAGSPWGRRMIFVLKRERPTHATEDLWGIYYGKKELANHQIGGEESRRVRAVRDPFCQVDANDYRSATTGDYDLFAVLPPRERQHGDLRRGIQTYNPTGVDDRFVPGSQTQRLGYDAFNQSESTGDRASHRAGLGNMTPRLLMIREALNRAIRRTGYTGGDMVHHSDEAGRPNVDDVDLPVIAFVPDVRDLRPWGIETLADMRTFLRQCRATHSLLLNPGWQNELGDEFFQ